MRSDERRLRNEKRINLIKKERREEEKVKKKGEIKYAKFVE